MRSHDVADADEKTPRISRRTWLAGLGGGLMSVPFVWWFEVPGRVSRSRDSQVADAPSPAYVDRDGWMLTPEDVAALAARPAAQ